MADTFGDMITEIVDETRRSMSSQIATCILDAITNYETERFWFNETRATTFSLSSSQDVYTSIDNSMIPRLMQIDRLDVVISGSRQKMEPWPYIDIETYNETGSTGQPVAYAYYGQSIYMTLPDGGYEARVSGIVQLASLSATTDSNAWTQRGNGKELIKQSAKARLYSQYLRDDANAQRAAAYESIALMRLRERTTSLQATGEIQPCL